MSGNYRQVPNASCPWNARFKGASLWVKFGDPTEPTKKISKAQPPEEPDAWEPPRKKKVASSSSPSSEREGRLASAQGGPPPRPFLGLPVERFE